MPPSLFLLAGLVVLCTAVKDMKSFVDHVQEVALNESLVAEYNDYFDKRTKIYQTKFFPDGNNVTGHPHYSCKGVFGKSKTRPTNAHSVRPNDIAVIGAMGDSITAGFGAGANSLMENLLEYRGLSFSIGGDGDLKYMTTLPNILQQYNSFVVGASRRVAPIWFKFFSQLNVAVSGAFAENMTSQAEELVTRVQADKQIDFLNDWKLVTLFIGSNDLCHYCEDESHYSASNYVERMRSAIQILYSRMPRTIVSIVSNAHIELLKETSRQSAYCEQMHKVACPCAVRPGVSSVVHEYQRGTRSLSQMFADKDDFVVVVQPFMEDSLIPTTSDGKIDFAFFAPDCFHFSQWGHSVLATALWNNLLESDNKKTTATVPNRQRLACPDPKCPFIKTAKNSKDCGQYLNANNFEVDDSKTGNKAWDADTRRNSDLEGRTLDHDNIGPVVGGSDRRTRPATSTIVLVTLGVICGLILGAVVGSAVLHALHQRRLHNRGVGPHEKTPLLAAQDHPAAGGGDTMVQVY